MRISNIQNFALNNFKYKNKPINFGVKYNPNSQGDIVELHQKPELDDDSSVACRKYFAFANDKEISPRLETTRSGRVFVKHRFFSPMPYSEKIKEYNAQGKLLKNTIYNNGYKYMAHTYDKNGQAYQVDMYGDTFEGCRFPQKRTYTRKLEGLDERTNTYSALTEITRNHDKDWESRPQITMKKKQGDNTLRVVFQTPPRLNGIGTAYVVKSNGSTQIKGIIFKDQEGEICEFVTDYKDILQGLEELKRTIMSDEYRDDFGFSAMLNTSLDKHIEVISSRINEG